MSENLEQKLQQDTTSQTSSNTIDSYTQPEKSEKKKDGFFKTAAKTIFTTTLVAATVPIVGLNSIYSTIGNGIGYLIETKKNKEKFNTSNFMKELSTGAVMGVVGTGIYTAIDKVPIEQMVSPLESTAPKYMGIIKNITKTLAFNPGLLIPYLAFYKGFTYIRDNYKKMKQKKYETGEGILKQTYQHGIKKDFGKGIFQLFKLFPIHYVNVNYIKNVPTRIMVGVANDILFRLFQKKQTKSVELKNPALNYSNPSKNYSMLQNSMPYSHKNPSIAASYA